MNHLKTLLLLLVLWTASPDVCTARSAVATHEAAQAMATIAIAGVKFAAAGSTGIDEPAMRCYASLQPSILHDAFSVRMEESMSTADMEKVDRFYASALGKRFVSFAIARKIGMPTDPDDFTKEEQDRAFAFTRTVEANKLFDLFLPDDPELVQLLVDIMKREVERCTNSSAEQKE